MDHIRKPIKPSRRGRTSKEKVWTDCVADNLRLFGIGDGDRWRTAALKPGKRWTMVMEGGRTFKKKRQAEAADKTPPPRA